MTEETARQEVVRALDAFHAAQKEGDVEAMLDWLSDAPIFISNGVPHGKARFRKFFQAQAERGAYRHVKVDMRRCNVSVAILGSEFAGSATNAVAEPVIHDGPEGRNVWSYTLLRGADGRWRITHRQVIPHPDEPAFTPELLSDAGRPLGNAAMAWTRKLAAPLDAVWRAVSTAEGLHAWWGGGPANQHRAKVLDIDLRVGGLFHHSWRSEIHELRERAFIDFGEFRFELRPDGAGTLFSLIVFSMDSQEWRAFWRCDASRLYLEPFGGLDPWSARSWHGVVDRLEHVLTGRAFEDAGENAVYSYPLTRFYLAYLRELHALQRFARRPALMRAGPQMDEGFARTERPLDEDTRKAKMYAVLQLRTEVHEPQSILAVEVEVSRSEDDRPFGLAETVRKRLPDVAQHLARLGATPAGPPLVRMLEKSPASFRVEIGYPISGDLAPAGEIQRRQLPGGTLVVADLTEGDAVVRAQNYWPWVIRYAQEQGFALDTGWGGNGGWQLLLNPEAVAAESGGRSQLRLPVTATS